MNGCVIDCDIAFGTTELERSGNRQSLTIDLVGKKPDRKRKNLIRLGIEKGQAYAWSRTKIEERNHECLIEQTLRVMGGWRVAQLERSGNR